MFQKVIDWCRSNYSKVLTIVVVVILIVASCSIVSCQGLANINGSDNIMTLLSDTNSGCVGGDFNG